MFFVTSQVQFKCLLIFKKTLPLRLFFAILTTFFLADSFGQNYTLPNGEYMDTTANTDTACKNYNTYYYQVGGKYPKSSITLLKEVQAFLLQKNKIYEGSGYITFRFRINCERHRMKRTKVFQTDGDYKSIHFDKKFVNELYLFVDTLNEWKISKNKQGKNLSYIALITFKIKNGKVINIIP